MSNVAMNQIQTNSCGICFPCDEETRLIELSLLDRLNEMKQKFYQEIKDEEANQNFGFQRLLKIIFHKKYKNFKESTTCKHEELKKQFSEKLLITFRVLDIFSQKIACHLAKYSFHIDVVSQQVKSFPRHFINQKAKNSPEKQREKQKEDEKTGEKQSKNKETCIPIKGQNIGEEPAHFINSLREQPFLFSNSFNPYGINFSLQCQLPHIKKEQQ